MDKKYIELFKEITRVTAISAEQVMEYDKKQSDEKGYEAARVMRDDFSELQDKLEANDFDGILTKAEYAKLLVGCYVIVGNLQDRIEALKKAIAGYQSDLVPKLSKIIEAENDAEAQKLADEHLMVETNT